MATHAKRLQARLEVDLEDGGEGSAVAGTFRGEDGVEHRFSGWMELAGLIEAWLAEGREGPRPGSSADSFGDP